MNSVFTVFVFVHFYKCFSSPQANKTLRSQNMDLVQENMRLKAEVASRSPQK